MAGHASGSVTASPRETRLGASARTSRLDEYRQRNKFVPGTQSIQQPNVSPQCLRQFRHSMNGEDGIASLCLKCGERVASAEDEWTLLEHERRHVCSKTR